MGNIISDIFLIDVDYIKEKSTVGDNLDPKYLNPCIAKAQVMDLQELIGTKLTKKLCEIVRDRPTLEPEPTPYDILLEEYVRPFLIPVIQAELLVSNYAKQRNAGNMQYLDTNQSNIPMEDMWKLHHHYENRASFMAKRLTAFIIANRGNYPEYCKIDNCADMHANPRSQKNCGWVL